MREAATAAWPRVTPLDAFRRLFESEFLTLEGFAISARAPEGMDYLDESVALERLLADGAPAEAPEPTDPALHALHLRMYEAWPEVHAAVSASALHLLALLAEGLPLPTPTSMMRKRGIADLGPHLVDADALSGPRADATLARAHETAVAHAMKHVLLVMPDGTVHVAAPTMEEAMAHHSNVEFAARVECIRLEEEAIRAR